MINFNQLSVLILFLVFVLCCNRSVDPVEKDLVVSVDTASSKLAVKADDELLESDNGIVEHIVRVIKSEEKLMNSDSLKFLLYESVLLLSRPCESLEVLSERESLVLCRIFTTQFSVNTFLKTNQGYPLRRYAPKLKCVYNCFIKEIDPELEKEMISTGTILNFAEDNYPEYFISDHIEQVHNRRRELKSSRF